MVLFQIKTYEVSTIRNRLKKYCSDFEIKQMCVLKTGVLNLIGSYNSKDEKICKFYDDKSKICDPFLTKREAIV